MERSRFHECDSRLERIISPQALWNDNHSLHAIETRFAWDEAQARQKQVLVSTCGDARVIVPPHTIRVKTIALGGDFLPYEGLFDSASCGMMMAHYDGDTALPGKRPEGCGGQDEKSNLDSQDSKPAVGVFEFVDKHVRHSDPVVNAVLTAVHVARISSKPILAAAQDHLTGEIKPLAIVEEGVTAMRSKIPLDQLFAIATGIYDPSSIYRDGIPSLSFEYLSDDMRDFLENHEKHLKAIHTVDQNLRLGQKVQNPRVLHITTDRRPGSLRFPDLLGMPNTVFELLAPRMSFSPERGELNEDLLTHIIQQAEYPVMHANKNRGGKGSFNQLNTIFVETRYSAVTDMIISRLLQNPHILAFVKSPSVHVLGGVDDQGELKDCWEVDLSKLT